jgi:16S rRNA (adenine1518-N6/adenine1519-N6)-dimethyltransferase
MGRRSVPSLGQHFLHDPAIAARIVDALEPDSRTVLEIGPGRGIITIPLAGRARRLVAVELDRRLTDGLQAEPALAQVAILQGDILDRPLQDWLDPPPEGRFLLAGNLPYQITSPVLFACMDAREQIERAVLMMQREVAGRLVADPGNKTYGIITVLTALFARVEMIMTVGRGAFKPPPRVESAVVRIDMMSSPLAGVDGPGGPSSAWVTKIVRAAFSQRRKMLRNSIAAGLPHLRNEDILEGASSAGIDLSRRPETLSPEEFVALAGVLQEPGGV